KTQCGGGGSKGAELYRRGRELHCTAGRPHDSGASRSACGPDQGSGIQARYTSE
ncbi:hypothetical protein HK405_014278, partial [Cladochytrium tenue]